MSIRAQLMSAPNGRGLRSIRTKLAVLVAVTIGLTLVVGTGVSLVQETMRYLGAKRETLVATAKVFGRAAAEPAVKRDEAAVVAAISGMTDIPGVIYVGVDDMRGKSLGDLGWATRLDSDAAVGERTGWAELIHLLSSRTVQVTVPLLHNGPDPVARITVIADASGVFSQLIETLALTVAGSGAALLIAMLVAFRMQRSLTAPILQLASTMAHVREAHAYDLTVPRSTDDEVGELVTTFNTMLVEIRDRDRKLAKHRENLEQEVADRTRDLRVAKLAAETANAAKSDFLATMSHEIRTPMNGMLVMAELLAAGELPARQRRYAEVIARSGQSLLAIINDILDFSKVEAGKMDLEQIPVDPAETADTVLNLFWERAQRKGLDLAASVAPDVPAAILSDPVRLNQVIGNLINNALKFTERGHVLLSIGCDPHHPSNLRFAVTDTGIGIPQDKIDTLFDAFAQVDQTTTRKFGGTGLGLAICKRLVEAMGGSFRVTSEYGRGSTFAFSIPIHGPAEERQRPMVMSLPGRRLPRAIVAVRGDATGRVLGDQLAACGYAVERQDPDDLRGGLPIVDVVVIEGVVAAGLPALDPASRPSHVVALTTLGDGAERPLEDGTRADAVLVRPLAPTEFETILGKIVSGQPLRGTVSQRKGRSGGLPKFPGCRVLVADDSAVNREVAVEALTRLGIRAEVVEDGRGAVQAAIAGGIDLILMDGSMPDIDGFEAARQIRAIEAREKRPRLPILALTAHVVGAAADLWKSAGMDGILHKPFTIATMAEVLGPWLAGKSREDAPDVEADEPQAIDAAAPVGEPAAAPAAVVASDGADDPEGPLLDADIMDQLQMMAQADGGAFLARVTGLYREHAPQTMDQLRQAIARGRDGVEDQAKAAHALKSMSYNVGAMRVAKAAAALETLTRVEGGVATSAHLEAIEALLARTLAALPAAPAATAPADSEQSATA